MIRVSMLHETVPGLVFVTTNVTLVATMSHVIADYMVFHYVPSFAYFSTDIAQKALLSRESCHESVDI